MTNEDTGGGVNSIFAWGDDVPLGEVREFDFAYNADAIKFRSKLYRYAASHKRKFRTLLEGNEDGTVTLHTERLS